MSPGQPVVILLADDDEDDRMMTEDAFRRHRLANDFYAVTDGEELMDFLYKRGRWGDAPRPGIILLDLNMPRKDGREALRDIKADPSLRTIPVVVLTTSREEEDILRSYNLGASSFIQKPVGFDSLVDIVGRLGEYWFQVVQLPGAGRP